MGRANLWVFLIPLAIFLAVFLELRRRITRLATASIAVAIVTTGFAGMAFNMVLILAFQSLYGYVYQMMALLIAAFMVGLAIGSTLMTRIMNRIANDKLLFVKIESLILAFSILVPAVLMIFHSHLGQPAIFALVQAVILVLSLVCGILVSSEFPLANKIYLKDTGRVSEVAGALYAVDLLGACVGAIIVSIWLIPVLGTVNTCIVIACLKVASTTLVATSKL
jgi:spermidine synthase